MSILDMNDPEVFRRDMRIGGIAVFDFFLTILFVIILTSLKFDIIKDGALNAQYFAVFLQIFIVVIILGIVVHKITGVNTTLNNKLGLSDAPVKFV